jgi:hemerythrin-like domain-containing protein
MDDPNRRALFTLAGASVLVAACRKEDRIEPTLAIASARPPTAKSAAPKDDGEPEVTATEDLMREHGVIRRVLVVYREAAAKLRAKPAAVSPDALTKAARLIRTFAEDYHEKQLEELHLFPAVKQKGGPAAAEIDLLLAQHQRGREITDYVLSAAQKTIGANAEPLAGTLEAFARMYEEHAAREDTIVFVAWKNALSPAKLEEMGDLFEDIEKKTFGKDGFEDAVQQASSIERAFGLDPGAFTAPPPKG